MSMATPAEADDDRRSWQELLVTVLLVVAALATSWSSYQATRWNGEQAAAAGRTNAVRILAARADGLARSQTQVDVATFIAWADADQRGETEIADFYVAGSVPSSTRPTRPGWPPGHSPTPRPPRRRSPWTSTRSRRRTRPSGSTPAAEASAAEVRLNIQRSSNYVLTVVLYAVVLFFAGMSTRLKNRRLRWVMTIAGCAVLLGALGWVATFPVSLAV